ncbi:MAG TPA: TIM barrel protein [Puia sp.]
MELGIGTYTYGWAVDAGQPFDEHTLIGLARSMQLSLIQVGDNLPLHRFAPERLGAFKDELGRQGIRIEIGARGLTAEHLKLYIELCGEMGSRLLRFVIDEDGYRPSVEVVTAIIRSQLDGLQRNNLLLAIENHDRFKVRQLEAIIKAVDSPNVGICLDTVNSLGAGEGIDTVIEVLAPYTVNLHLKDFGIRRPPNKQGFIVEGRIAGEGQLDISLLLEKVGSSGRCNTGVLEQWVPFEEDAAQTIARERDWAERGIGNLKKIIYDKNFAGWSRRQNGVQADG